MAMGEIFSVFKSAVRMAEQQAILAKRKASTLEERTLLLEEKTLLLEDDMTVLKDDMAVLKDDMTDVINRLDNITDVTSKLEKIIQLFSITFDSNGNIISNNYTSHTHSYKDATIADTAEGTGTLSETTKTTGTKV